MGITIANTDLFVGRHSRLSMEAPSNTDIICVKNKKYLHHPGNELFRSVISSFQDEYSRARGKNEKMKITKTIVDLLHSQYHACFVRPGKNGTWQEISSSQARDKVGHALRFALQKNGASSSKEEDRRYSLCCEGSVCCSSNGSATTCCCSSSCCSSEQDEDDGFALAAPVLQRQEAVVFEFQLESQQQQQVDEIDDSANVVLEETELLTDADFDVLLNDATNNISCDEWDTFLQKMTF